MKKTISYALSAKNIFGNWAYSGKANYYLSKIIGVFDNETGEEVSRYYEPLNAKFAYRSEKIDQFRGLKVEEI